MARFDNPFALLGNDDDGTNVAAIMDRIAAEKEAAQKEEAAADQKKVAVEQRKPVYDSENGRGRERGGRGQSHGGRGGRGYGRQSNGYNDNYQYQRQSNGYKHNYQRQNSEGLENGTDVQEKGQNVYVNRYENGNNNAGRGGYIRPRREFRNGEHLSYGGQDGGRNGRNDPMKRVENSKKEEQYVDNANNANNANGASGREMHEGAEVAKAVEPEKVLSEQEKTQLEENEHIWKERKERKLKELEEDAKKLTLSQFEEKQQEKRKELEEKLKKFAGEYRTVEGLKTGERTFVLEPKFEGMQAVLLKREEEYSTKPKSEKEKPKMKDTLGKEEKIRKAIIPNFHFPRREGNNSSSGNGQDRGAQFQKPERNSGSEDGRNCSQDNRNGGNYRGGSPVRVPEPEPKVAPAPKPAPKIEDGGQFPDLSKSVLIK